MKNLIFILVLIFIGITSCKKKEIPYLPSPVNEPEEEELNYTILHPDSMLWVEPIDSVLFQNNTSIFCHHPIVYEDKIIWNPFGMGGFVAYNRFTGEIEWDNRGILNTSSIPTRPIIEDNNMYYFNTSGVRGIDLDNGNIDVRYLWPNSNEYLKNTFNIQNGKIYGSVYDWPDNNKYTEYVYCPVDELNTMNWSRVNKSEFVNDTSYTYYTSAIYKNHLDEEVLIHIKGTNPNPLIQNDNIGELVAFNIDKNSIEWSARIDYVNGAKLILDEDRVYVHGFETICVDAKNGEIIWSFGEEDGFTDQLHWGAGLFLYENMLIALGHAYQVVALDKFTGDKLWDISISSEYVTDESDAGGSEPYTANVYNGRLYYTSISGSLMSVDLKDGSYRRFHLPEEDYIKELDRTLNDKDFGNMHLTISEDGIVYASDGLRFMAFEVPDKNW